MGATWRVAMGEHSVGYGTQGSQGQLEGSFR